MSKITNDLYDLTRTIGKIASTSNDVDNLMNGKVEKVVKKHIKKNIHKEINKLLK